MTTKNLIQGDYKKWLLYSFDKQEFKDYYDLFKSLKATENFGKIKFNKSDDGLTYTLAHNAISDELEITEAQRGNFLQYLVENYFHTENVDEILIQKTQQADKGKNHNYIPVKDTTFQPDKDQYVVKPHPKETFYYTIKLIISFIFYTILAGLLVYGIIGDLTLLYSFAAAIPVILVVLLLNKLVQGIFIGIIKGSSIQITKDQFPEIYTIIKEQAAKLQLKQLPEIYITTGHFNAFVTRFSRSNILMIYSEVVETTLTGNYDVLKYVTAHELCHIKQKHLTKEKYLFPSKVVPFLGLAYSRGCEYTCDRTGYNFSPKGSLEGILIMTTGKEIHSKFNIELHIKNAIANEGFTTWFSEKFLTHPHLYKRLVEIKKYSAVS